jgi:hypothetical protein
VGHWKGVGPETDTFLGPAVRKVTSCTRPPIHTGLCTEQLKYQQRYGKCMR